MGVSRLLVVAAIGLAGCGGDSPTETDPRIVGAWKLLTLGDAAVPIVCLPINCPAYTQFGMLGRRIDVLGSTLTITTSENWSETFDLSVVTETGTIRQTRTIYGTHRRDGALVHLSGAGDPAYLDCEVGVDTLTCDDGRGRYSP